MAGAPPAEPAPEPVVEAAPPPEPRRRSLAVLWVVLFLALVAGGGFAYVKFLSIPDPKLVVWMDDVKDVEIQVQAGAAIPRNPQGEYSPGPGPCTVTISRQGKPVEVHRFTILPGALHLCVVGGAPVDAAVDSLALPFRHPWAGALFGCAECHRLDTGSRCGGCKKERAPVSAAKTLKVTRSAALAEGNPSERAVILVNPYAADLAVEARTAANSVSFPLSKESIRAIPHAESISLKCTVDGDVAALEEREVKPASGVSLYTVGGATWFEWLGDGGSGAAVATDFLSLVKLEQGAKLLAADPGGAGLLRRETAGRMERLVPIFSHALIAPASPAPGKIVNHPGVEVAEVTLPASLAGKTIEAIAAGDAGAIAIADGSAYALSTGEKLNDGGPGIRSAALGSDGLFLLTRQSTCATLEGRSVVTGPALTDPTLCAWAPRAGGAVYLHGGRFVPGLLIMTPQGPQPLLPAYPPVTALGNMKDGVLVARGRIVEKLTVVDGRAKLEPVLVLPDGPAIVGLHDAGGPLVISTESRVFVLSDNVVLTVAQGVGGSLHPCKGGVLLHDRASRRLFRIKSSMFRD
jgi:hypothetical protein